MEEAFPRNPLRNYQFRVGLLDSPLAETADGEYIAGVQKVSGLNVTVEANETWSGGNSLHRYANPNRVSWDPITLEQGLALSDTLERWARAALEFARTGVATGSEQVKRNVFIDVWDPNEYRRGSGFTVGPDRLRRYLVFNAWVSRYQALPQLDAMANQVALLSVEMVHEGWRLATGEEVPGSFTHNA